MTAEGRIQCPWDWSSDRALRSRADSLHISAAMWAEPYEQEPPRSMDEKDFALMRLSEVAKLQEKLAEAIAEAARDARRYGGTWDEIGSRLGVTKQAAQKRFGR